MLMRVSLLSLLGLLLTACALPPPPQPQVQPTASPLTPGMVKTKLIAGKTTQAEVLEIFGPPDLVTKSGPGELWGYEKVSRESFEAAAGVSGGIGLGVGGVGVGVLGGALGGVGGGSSQSQRVESTKTVFLLVYFDEKNVVLDYKLSATRF